MYLRRLHLLFGSVAVAAVGADGAACLGQTGLLPNPPDPSVHGPYPVGAVLGHIEVSDGRLGMARNITVEAWYPALPGSEVGAPLLGYDIREQTPPRQRAKLADAANLTYQPCKCFRDLPVANGSFPVVLFIHGTAAFRTESLHQQTHWASRGFVVVAADHPGIQLYDLLDAVDGRVPPRVNQESDARGILVALAGLPATLRGFAPLAGHLDLGRVGVVGHSAGGFACDQLGDVADVLIPMAGFAPMKSGPRARSTLVLAARNDTVVGYEREEDAFNRSSALPRRFASVDALGHLFCSDLCWIGESAGGIVKIAQDHHILVAKAFAGLGQNGCSYLNRPSGPHFLPPQCGWLFVNYASTAALEETLRCDAAMAGRLRGIRTGGLHIPSQCPASMVFDYREEMGGATILV